MKNLLQLLALSAALLAFWGCGPDDAPEPDPCGGLDEFTPGFVIDHYIGSQKVSMKRQLETGDSIIYGALVTCYQSEDYDSIQWLINEKPIKRNHFETDENNIARIYLDEYYTQGGEWLKLTLVAYPHNPECYENPSIDSAFKLIYVREQNYLDSLQQAYLGEHMYYRKGYPQDTLNMKVHYGVYPRNNVRGYYVTGFPEYCDDYLILSFQDHYAVFRDDLNNGCWGGGFLPYDPRRKDFFYVSNLPDENYETIVDTLSYHLIRKP